MPTLYPTGESNLRVSADGVFYGHRKISGKVHTKSFETKDRRDAIELKHVFMATAGRKLPKNRKIKCTEAFDKFISDGYGPKGSELAPATKELYSSLWRLYAAKKLGRKRVIDVEPHDIIGVLRAARDEHGVKGSRLRNLWVALGSFFQMQTIEPTRHREDNPVQHIGAMNRPPKPQPKDVDDDVVLSESEIDRIAANFTREAPPATGRGGARRFKDSEWVATAMRMLFLLLTESGLRVGEVLALGISDVRYRKNGVHAVDEPPRMLVTSKQRAHTYRATVVNSDPFAGLKGNEAKLDGQVRRIPLSPFIARELAAYLEHGLATGNLRPDGLLFPNTRQRMFNRSQVRRLIIEAAKRAGITRKITTHHTRHTFVSNRIESGVDRLELSEVTGHSEKVLVKHYAHRDEESEAYERMRKAGRQ